MDNRMLPYLLAFMMVLSSCKNEVGTRNGITKYTGINSYFKRYERYVDVDSCGILLDGRKCIQERTFTDDGADGSLDRYKYYYYGNVKLGTLPQYRCFIFDDADRAEQEAKGDIRIRDSYGNDVSVKESLFREGWKAEKFQKEFEDVKAEYYK